MAQPSEKDAALQPLVVAPTPGGARVTNVVQTGMAVMLPAELNTAQLLINERDAVKRKNEALREENERMRARLDDCQSRLALALANHIDELRRLNERHQADLINLQHSLQGVHDEYKRLSRENDELKAIVASYEKEIRELKSSRDHQDERLQTLTQRLELLENRESERDTALLLGEIAAKYVARVIASVLDAPERRQLLRVDSLKALEDVKGRSELTDTERKRWESYQAATGRPLHVVIKALANLKKSRSSIAHPPFEHYDIVKLRSAVQQAAKTDDAIQMYLDVIQWLLDDLAAKAPDKSNLLSS
jgi:chromosome segregation ATPase